MRKRSKKQDLNDNASNELPPKANSRRRGRGKRIEKEKVKTTTAPKPIDDIKFNRKVMDNLEKSGAVNYLIAKMFTQLSIYANQRHRKRYLIESDFKSFIKPEKKNDDDYSDDDNYDSDNIQERNRIKHLIASRIVYEYLIDHQLNLTKYALQNETKNDKAFSSKTPASFSPLHLDDYNLDKVEENINQKSETIKKIILANKETEKTLKPPPGRNTDDEIVFSAPKQKTNRLKGKNSLNSDFSLPSLNSSSLKQIKVSEHESNSLRFEEEEEEINESDSNTDLSEEHIENNEEESSSNSQNDFGLFKTPESLVKSKAKGSQRPPNTVSPKKPQSPSIMATSPSKTTTPTKILNSSTKESSPDKILSQSLSSSNFELDNDLMNKIIWPKPQSPTHTKNEIDTNDFSTNLENQDFVAVNLDPINKSSSQVGEEIQKQQIEYSQDSLDNSSGSEHELQAEKEYSSDVGNN